jgi:type IX secretion system PorP/SprF family membrane protein
VKIKLYISLCLGLLFVGLNSHAQDIHFSQFYNANQAINPASAGAQKKWEGTLNHRKQWASVSVPFTSFMASFAGQITQPARGKKGHWAAGAYTFSDLGGDGSLRTTSIAAGIAYHIRLSRYEKIGFALQPAFVSRSLDFSKFQWGSQYSGMAHDPTLPVGEYMANSVTRYLDLGTGIYYSLNNTRGYIKVTGNHYKQINAGLSFHHLNRPYYSFMSTQDRLYIKMILHANALWSLESTPFAVQPVFSFSKQGPHNETVLGGNVRYELLRNSKYTGIFSGTGLYFGMLYRVRDAAIFNLSLDFSNYQFGVSYDVNASRLSAASNGRGAIEFSLRIMEKGLSKTVTTQKI